MSNEGIFIAKNYKEANKRAIAKRNNLNKQRARAMEQRVAKFLGGHRVPMSGSGSLKGDAIVMTKYGLLVLECKTSEAYDEKYKHSENAFLTLNTTVLDKIEKERKLMNAKFGVVVIHHVRKKKDYVILRLEDYQILFKLSEENLPVNVYKKQRLKLYKHELDLNIERYGAMFIQSIVGNYIAMTLEQFKALVCEET